MNYSNFIKDFINFEFKKYKIPSGYHNVNLTNSSLIIKSTELIYSYSKHYNEIDIINSFPIEVISVDKSDIEVIIKVNFNNVNKVKCDLFIDYPNIYFEILNNKSINYEFFHKELKAHLITDKMSHFNQELFDNLCTINEEYYCNVANENFRSGLDVNYDNFELIKFMVGLSDIKFDYGHLVIMSQRLNYEELKYILKYIKLDNAYENYLLLKDIIKRKDVNLIKLLLNSFVNFKDHGILNELMINWELKDAPLLETLLSDERITKLDLIEISIEYNNIELYKYLIQEGYKPTQYHLENIKKYKRHPFLQFKK